MQEPSVPNAAPERVLVRAYMVSGVVMLAVLAVLIVTGVAKRMHSSHLWQPLMMLAYFTLALTLQARWSGKQMTTKAKLMMAGFLLLMAFTTWELDLLFKI